MSVFAIFRSPKVVSKIRFSLRGVGFFTLRILRGALIAFLFTPYHASHVQARGGFIALALALRCAYAPLVRRHGRVRPWCPAAAPEGEDYEPAQSSIFAPVAPPAPPCGERCPDGQGSTCTTSSSSSHLEGSHFLTIFVTQKW